MNSEALNTKVLIVDYGLGNILSVARALQVCGAHAEVSSSPEDVLAADRIVIPGVGAFADGMQGLREANLISALQAAAAHGKPVLGICLGMQLLMSNAEEFGHHEGLDIVPGEVKPIPNVGADHKPHKIPHVGWNKLQIPESDNLHQSQDFGDPLFQGIAEPHFYFVHSYSVIPQNKRVLIADAHYNGCRIAATIRQGNVYGCQFHPEKSGPAGLRLLTNFISLS